MFSFLNPTCILITQLSLLWGTISASTIRQQSFCNKWHHLPWGRLLPVCSLPPSFTLWFLHSLTDSLLPFLTSLHLLLCHALPPSLTPFSHSLTHYLSVLSFLFILSLPHFPHYLPHSLPHPSLTLSVLILWVAVDTTSFQIRKTCCKGHLRMAMPLSRLTSSWASVTIGTNNLNATVFFSLCAHLFYCSFFEIGSCSVAQTGMQWHDHDSSDSRTSAFRVVPAGWSLNLWAQVIFLFGLPKCWVCRCEPLCLALCALLIHPYHFLCRPASSSFWSMWQSGPTPIIWERYSDVAWIRCPS